MKRKETGQSKIVISVVTGSRKDFEFALMVISLKWEKGMGVEFYLSSCHNIHALKMLSFVKPITVQLNIPCYNLDLRLCLHLKSLQIGIRKLGYYFEIRN